MPILYLVTRDTHDDDEACDVDEWHWWEPTKRAALNRAESQSGCYEVWAKVHRINLPATKRGLLMVARLEWPENFAELLGQDKVQKVAEYQFGEKKEVRDD